MEYFICILLLAVGLVLIIKGGDWFVDAASWIAKVSGVPTFIIGATIVSIGTTLPEILTSCISAANGSTGLAIGNAVGSVNANIAMIMAVSLLCMPVAISRKEFFPKSAILLVAISVLWATCSSGTLGLGLSFVVLAVFIVFIVENVYTAKKQASTPPTLADTIIVDDYHMVSADEGFALNADGTITKLKTKSKADKKEIVKHVVLFILGAAGIAGGAMLLSTYGEKLASLLGVPDDIIGVTIIAVGTSLPELTTAIISIKKKTSEMSVGNIIGANVIDITLILPLCSIISGGALPVAQQTLVMDLPFCLAVAAVALIPALISGKFHRWQGGLLLAGYATYITLLILNVLGTISIF